MEARPTRKTVLFGNFFQAHIGGVVYKYNVNVETIAMLTPLQHQELVKRVVLKHPGNRAVVAGHLGQNFMFLNCALYSTSILPFPIELAVNQDEYPGVKVEVVQDAQLSIEKDPDIFQQLMGRFFRALIKKLKMKQIGRKVFDPSKQVKMDMFEIWPGFSTSMIFNSGLSLINVDMVSKIITNTNVLGIIETIKQRNSHELETALTAQLVGKSVMTIYNRRFYRIDRVALDMSPLSSITKEDGSKMSLMEYYQNRYEKVISVENQPLLCSLDKKDGREIFLIPELCVMTGLSEEQRANRNLMTELDKIIKPDASQRLMRSRGLVEAIYQQEALKPIMQEWKIQISKDPLRLEGLRIEAGNLLFGDKSVDIENSQNLDRDTQARMLINKPINTLIIFYPRFNKNEFQSFYDMTKTVFVALQIQCKEIKPVEVPDFRSFDPIKGLCQKELNPQVTASVWILPGNKKAGQHYDKLKRLMVNNLPAPSQMILAKTIGAGKNLRSIVTKMYVQLMAKIGGVPWAISDLPFTSNPVMAVGLDVYSKPGVKGQIFSMVATMNNTLSTYWSNSAFAGPELGFEQFVYMNFRKVLEKFRADNRILPQKVVVFRDGVSKGQRDAVRAAEVNSMRKAASEIYPADSLMRMVFVGCNKTSNAKFFFSPNGGNDYSRLSNPLQGSYISQTVTNDENEFYLLCQKTFRGLASPTSFYLLENDLTEVDKQPVDYVRDLVAKLAFKLSFLYYNTTGAIKVPAPIHYAQKLSYFVGDQSSGSDRIIPHSYLGQIQSLYFI